MPDPEIPGHLEDMSIIITNELKTEIKKEVLTIDQFIRKSLSSGMEKDNIRQILKSDLQTGGQLFGDFRKNIKSTCRNGLEDAARKEVLKEDARLWDWVGISDNKICDDCLERNNMEARTKSEWAEMGLPGEGATVCGANCRCVLMPVGTLDKKSKPIVREE